jgi:hypothetical protein
LISVVINDELSEHGNETPISIKAVEFLHYLSCLLVPSRGLCSMKVDTYVVEGGLNIMEYGVPRTQQKAYEQQPWRFLHTFSIKTYSAGTCFTKNAINLRDP